MDFTKYTKVIERLARGLHNGKIDRSQITNFLEKEFGVIESNTDTSKFMTMDEVEVEEKRQKEEFEFNRKYQPLKNAFINILESISNIQKNVDPFTIKFNSHKIIDNYKILKQHQDDLNYDVVQLKTIHFISEFRNDINITKEHIKILDKKYL